MARIRTIKPEFFTDEDLSAQPPLVRLFFAGLFCHADRDGRLKYKPRELKVQILPFDKLSGEKAVDALVAAGFVLKYEVAGETYLQIRNWVKHQRPHHTEKESELPPSSNGLVTVKTPLENGRKGREGKGKERKGKEGKGREGKVNGRSIDGNDHKGIDWEEAERLAVTQGRKLKEYAGQGKTNDVWRLLLTAAALVQTDLSEDWFADAVEGVCQVKPQKPTGYLAKCLTNGAKEKHKADFGVLRRSITIPEELLTGPDQRKA